MGVEVKTEWFGCRVGPTKAKKIAQYCEDEGHRHADFVRMAMDEFIANHPHVAEASHE